MAFLAFLLLSIAFNLVLPMFLFVSNVFVHVVDDNDDEPDDDDGDGDRGGGTGGCSEYCVALICF